MGDACDPDDDNDGLSDIVETNTGTFVSPSDTGTNSMNSDTDGDGFSDGVEVLAGTDPNDANSKPVTNQTPSLPPTGQLVLILSLLGAGLGTRRLMRRRTAA